MSDVRVATNNSDWVQATMSKYLMIALDLKSAPFNLCNILVWLIFEAEYLNFLIEFEL